jgi:hypothetical protein
MYFAYVDIPTHHEDFGRAFWYNSRNWNKERCKGVLVSAVFMNNSGKEGSV